MEFPHIVTELDVAYELRDENALRLGLEALAAQGFDVHNAPWRNFALEVSIVKKAQEMLETITRVRLHLQEARLTMNMESMKAALDEAQLIMYQPEQVPTRTSLQLTPIAAVPCTLRWLAHVRVCFIRWSSFASCIQV
jgi:hypothetical protein